MLDPLPGSAPHPPPLAEALGRAVAARGPGFVPRTRHRQGAAPRFTNRLALESSPYLLQHAHNPVDWRPWGDEAFAEARSTHRPVFLSVGYSTCHWCHVMEEESFEDLEIAAFLNQHYVCIKVDREERPDVDAVYMTAVQALSGAGGWPMSVWLNGDREPFFGGTYFPPRDGDRGAPVGFLSALRQIEALWRTDRLRVSRAAGTLAEAVRTALSQAGEPAPGLPGLEAVEAGVRGWVQRFDDQHGGLVGAPKFPSSLPARLLLRHHRRSGDAASLRMAVHSLERMAAGGLHDQLAGGFHRYSTDARWLVPHFEKMLYDNALLALAYAEAWQATGRADFARVLRSTLDWMLREMALPEGGLASATDADSEGEEGRFFAWTAEEIARCLGPEAERFCAFHGVTAEGNFEGKNVLHVPRPDEAEWQALAPARERLRLAREERPHPLRDDKVLAAWNGLALSALAVGGRALGEPRYVAGGERMAGFLLGALRPEGRLHRSWNAGRLGPPAYLEDHAFLCRGLLDLHEATLEVRWLAEARALAEELERRFAAPAGGWYVTPADGEQLIARQRPSHDGAEPSGASVAALAALRLAALTGEDRWRQVADGALRAHGETLAQHPMALAEMLLALELRHGAPRELVLVWPGEEGPGRLLAPLRARFEPALVITGAREGAPLEALARVAPVAEGKRALGGQPTAYLCRQGACGLPTTDPAELLRQLDGP